MKVAVVQRICAPYRVPVFEALARRSGIDLTLFCGRGTAEGQWRSARDTGAVRAVLLPTLSLRLRTRRREHYLVIHPTLVPHLGRGRYDVVLAEGTTNFLDNLALIPWCRTSGIPLALWDSGRDPGHPMEPGRRAVEPMLQRMFRSADACVGYGRASRGYFLDIGVRPESVFLAPNTVDLAAVDRDFAKWAARWADLEALKESLGLRDRQIVLHVGSLQRNKPLDPLIEACARLDRPGSRTGLLVVGDGGDRARLERLARNRLGDGARFLGRVTEDLGRYALISDVAAFPEGATLGILVALGYGLPVVSGRGRSPEHEAIEDGRNGIVVPRGDAEALARALAGLLGGAIRLAPSTEIRAHVRATYSLDRMVDGLEGALQYAASQRGAAREPVPGGTGTIR